jgi:hypothetical protein
MSKSENIQIHKYLTRPSRPTANESVDVRSLMSSNRRNEVTQILLNDINDFRKKNTLYPNQKYIFNINKLQEIVKEKTGKIVDSEFLKEIKENLDPEIKKDIYTLSKGGSTLNSIPYKEEKYFAKNYDKKTISQMATDLTGLPYDNKITKAKQAQLYRYYLTQTKIGNIIKEDVARGTRPKGTTPKIEGGFSAYRKAQQDLMNLNPDLYQDLTPAQVDSRLKKALQFSKVRGAFDVPLSLTASFEHFQGITPGTITQDPSALTKVGITTRDFNFNVLGAKAKNNIYKTIKNELRTAKASTTLGDTKAAKEALNNVNEIYDDIAKKLGTIDRKKLPKYNLNKNIINEVNLKALDFDVEKNLGNTIEDYIRFVAAGPEKDIAKIKQPNLAKAVELVKEGEDKALKDLIKSRVPAVRQNQLFSEIFPGARATGEFISGMAEDVASKSYGKLAFKSLGALGVGYGIYDAGVAFQEGKSGPEMAFRFVGVDPLYNTIKKYQRLPEDAQEIQKKINAQQSFDMSQSEMMDEGLVGMRGRPEVTEEEKMYLNNQYQIVEEKIKQEDKDRAEGRSGVLNMIRQKVFDATGQPYSVAFANGGRVFLEKGGKPKNFGRRRFLKFTGQGITLLGTLPFLGKFIKPIAKEAPEMLEVISRSADNVPDYLLDLIGKVKMMGKSKILGKADNPDGFVQYDLGEYTVVDSASSTRIKKTNYGSAGDEIGIKNELEMEIRKDPETGALEYDEVEVFPDAEGKMKEVEFGIEDSSHQDMKKFTYED